MIVLVGSRSEDCTRQLNPRPERRARLSKYYSPVNQLGSSRATDLGPPRRVTDFRQVQEPSELLEEALAG
jgi:hypothetical protein